MTNINLLILLIALTTVLPFGITFAEDNDTNASTQDASTSYRLATGDRVRIEVFGEDDLKRDVTLTDNGKISYPFLGELKLEGITLRELETLIRTGLQGAYLINPDVNVSVIEYRPFFINGEIKKSGSYPYQPGLTLRKAIALAGGFTEYASQENITVIHENDFSKTPVPIQFDKAISPGDIITITEYRRIFINGQVKNPGSYPYKAGLTLRKIITLAGGFTQRADTSGGYIISEDDEDQESKEIELEDNVSPGDIITIKQSFF